MARSPFPGMDPYLEDPAVWEEFHHVLITECMYLLADQLPPPYIAKIQERVQSISIEDAAAAMYVADVAVARDEWQDSGKVVATPAAGNVLTEPVVIPALETIEAREGYVQILRLPDHELVTSIEVLSPWSKSGGGIGEYHQNRRALVAGGVHVVEIDLLRRGTRTQLRRPLPGGDYYAMVFRADRWPDVQVYAWGVRDAVPPLAIPLRAPDPDARMDLAAVLATAYERGRYARKLRYDRPPVPPLATDDAAWADALVHAVEHRRS